MTEEFWLKIKQGKKETFLHVSRIAVAPPSLVLIQRVPGMMKATHLCLVPTLRMCETTPLSHVHLHGDVLT